MDMNRGQHGWGVMDQRGDGWETRLGGGQGQTMAGLGDHVRRLILFAVQ